MKDFYLLDEINTKIELFKSAGLVEFWHSKFINMDLLNVKDEQHPEVIKLVKIKGCFDIFLIGCFISFNVFVIELTLSKLSRCHQK
jgi:hypothetical protein